MQGEVYLCPEHGVSLCKVVAFGPDGMTVGLECGCRLPAATAEQPKKPNPNDSPISLTVKPDAVFPVDVSKKQKLTVKRRRY